MLRTPFYDPTKSYEENYDQGPFGELATAAPLKRTGRPKNSFLGEKVYQPFGIPAGPLLNSRFVQAAFAQGFDVCVYKTVRTRAQACHPVPNVLGVRIQGNLTLKKAAKPLVAQPTYTEPLSITNSFGVPSKDPDVWQPDMAKAVQAAGVGQVMIGSFQGTHKPGGSVADFIADYVQAARLVAETDAKILEANLSCPNEGTAELLCFDIERVQQIATAIKAVIGNKPLILKLAYFADDGQLEKLVRAVGNIVDGLSVINTIPAPIVDAQGHQALPGAGRARSGVCGAGIRWAGLEMVERLNHLRQRLKSQIAIVGVGGVMSAADYQQYRQAGADAVMSATGAMWNPFLAREINQES